MWEVGKEERREWHGMVRCGDAWRGEGVRRLREQDTGTVSPCSFLPFFLFEPEFCPDVPSFPGFFAASRRAREMPTTTYTLQSKCQTSNHRFSISKLTPHLTLPAPHTSHIPYALS
jgi:hypothetical protein